MLVDCSVSAVLVVKWVGAGMADSTAVVLVSDLRKSFFLIAGREEEQSVRSVCVRHHREEMSHMEVADVAEA